MKLSPLRTVLGFGVDLLPGFLWSPAHSTYLGMRLHFCYGGEAQIVRTVEWRGREVIQGHRPRSLSW